MRHVTCGNASLQAASSRSRLLRLLPLLAFLLATPSCASAPDPNSELASILFNALHTGDPHHIRSVLHHSISPAPTGSAWPTSTYLLAESYLRIGDTEAARNSFQALASWAVTNYPSGPYADTWGGSGLSVVALWRWLTIVDEHGLSTSTELDALLQTASKLQETRFYSRMVRSRLLPALPLLEERVRHMLAHITWTAKRYDDATQLYLDFLAVHSSGPRDDIDDAIRRRILQRGLATEARLDLYVALRQLDLSLPRHEKDVAADTLFRLYRDETAPIDVRATAAYEWANYYRLRARSQAVNVLTDLIGFAPDDGVIERAFYRRGTIYRALGDRDQFRKDMTTLLERFPLGALAYDARAQLATDSFYENDLDSALEHYGVLRTLEPPADSEGVAYFYPALGLFARNGNASDLQTADDLLSEYLLRYPNTPYRGRYLFWRGRIAERVHDLDVAAQLYRQVIAEAPYGYYGLRARMHLESQESAKRESLPGVSSSVYRELRAAYDRSRSRIPTSVDQLSPYHHRLNWAVTNGLYGSLLETEERLETRIDGIPLDDLDARGLTPFVALLISLRQDAMAARDVGSHSDNWLQLIALLSRPEIRDWPAITDMAIFHNDAQRRLWAELQRQVAFLATWYPGLDRAPTWAAEMVAAAWEIEGSHAVTPALMYALIRHVSGFYSQAISPQGATGLFQFMPETLADVMEGIESTLDINEELALNPVDNIALWRRWVRETFPVERRREIASAVIRHQAGPTRLADWTSFWERAGALDDVEFQVETIRVAATRDLVRRVLRDTAIVEAAGILVK